MRCLDIKRDENYNEYLRLKQNDDYVDVTFDEESGGVSAVHRFHKFDKQLGVNGERRGDYERRVIDVLRKNGHRVVLESETSSQGVKICDGYLDDIPMEIKAVEGNGTWTISTKLINAVKQRAQCVVLFFPKADTYSEFRVQEGIRLFNSNPSIVREIVLDSIIVLVEDSLVSYWNKKATPIEGWSISEGLRGQNGADPFTIPPSDAKV